MQPPKTDLESRVLAEARRLGHIDLLLERRLVVGVSGGADSLALLQLLVRLRATGAAETLHVAHMDHGIRGQAAQEDAHFVKQIAESWGIPVTLAEFDVPAYAERRGLSTEDAARRARYAFLASVAQQFGGAVAVAHTADDQAETVLMAVLRGTGLNGLAGMRPLDNVHLPDDTELMSAFPRAEAKQTQLYRPLLGVWREEISTYCEQLGLAPRIDETNADLSYRRNRIRHDLIPYLQEHYTPAIKDHLVRLAAIARSEDEFGEALAGDAWENLANADMEAGRVSFATADFALEPLALRRRLTRRAFRRIAGTLADFTFAHVEDAAGVLTGAEGAPASLDLPHGVRVERAGDTSTVRKRALGQLDIISDCRWPVLGDVALRVEPGATLELEGGWTLESVVRGAVNERPNMGDWRAAFDLDLLAELGPLVLRRRAPGDFMRPFGMSGRRRLQDLMVDAKIPRECRPYLAVLAPQGSRDVLWVPGPGGRRSCYAPLTRDTRRVLSMRFSRQDQAGAI